MTHATSGNRYGDVPLDLTTTLIVAAWECGAITSQTACAALGVDHATLFELEIAVAEQGAALARTRAAATPATEAA